MAKRAKPNPNPMQHTHQASTLGLQKYTLPHSIMEVISTLQRAGFVAYIVGGGVRDGLLGIAPKDFDAVTDARPHEIKSIFGGRCRVIGKRFLLAHVYSGRELIEVATFRAPPMDDTHTTDEGMITRDNAWGTIEQDFARRDFSVNALYYNPIKGEVLDFCGAVDDIKHKTLRLLGDAKKRIEEDPVRLLRALRFKAKLGFEFDKNLAKQFNDKNWTLLENVSTHRLYDETQKMYSGGYISTLLPLLYEYGAIQRLMAYPKPAPTPLMAYVAKSTDERVATDRGANPAYFYAAMLWEAYLFQLNKLKKKLPFYDAQLKAAQRVIAQQRQKTAIPHFAEEFITDIWLLQPRLVAPHPQDIETLAKHPRFRAGFDFLVARETADDCPLAEPTNGMAKWWTQYQVFDVKGQAKLIELLTPKSRRKKRTDQPKAMMDELTQIHQLGLGVASTAAPAPLFVSPHKDNPNKPVPRPRKTQVPSFEPKVYSDDDFAKLLNNDEPYIPAERYRKRVPSSTLSIKEKEQGITEPKTVVLTMRTTTPPATTKTRTVTVAKTKRKVANAPTPTSTEPKNQPKKPSKKSTATPRADKE